MLYYKIDVFLNFDTFWYLLMVFTVMIDLQSSLTSTRSMGIHNNRVY